MCHGLLSTLQPIKHPNLSWSLLYRLEKTEGEYNVTWTVICALLPIKHSDLVASTSSPETNNGR